jgi:hypothetical protein
MNKTDLLWCLVTMVIVGVLLVIAVLAIERAEGSPFSDVELTSYDGSHSNITFAIKRVVEEPTTEWTGCRFAVGKFVTHRSIANLWDTTTNQWQQWDVVQRRDKEIGFRSDGVVVWREME